MASSVQFDSLPTFYHQSLVCNDISQADAIKRIALQTTAHRGEAQTWQGIEKFKSQQYAIAFLHMAQAIQHLPAQAPIYALLARTLQEQGLLHQALKLVDAALNLFPTESCLLCSRVVILMAMHEAKLISGTSIKTQLQKSILNTVDHQELKQILEAMKALIPYSDLPSHQSGLTGVVWYDAVQQQIGGWAVDLQNPARPLEIEIEFEHRKELLRARFQANKPHALLHAVYGISHGSFLVTVPQSIDALTVRCADGPALIGSPVAAMPVFQPPVHAVKAKKPPRKQPVDILIPVYTGRDATLECVHSVISSLSHNRTAYNLIVLNDASPDQELAAALEKLGRQGKLRYLRNPANLGFIRNMNRGMALHPERDVIWLNADTRVHGDWIDRLRNAAYSANDIASVTPFTNNGELMSVPRMLHPAPMPDAQAHAILDNTLRLLDMAPVTLEFGCGFCMYIKRQALQEVGYLDEVSLKRGYGEETDWCFRAQSKGWRHVGAVNIFVAHAGGHSFGAEKALRAQQNNAVILERYPAAMHNFNRYVAADPLAFAREKLARAISPNPPSETALKASVANTQANTQAAFDWLQSCNASTSAGSSKFHRSGPPQPIETARASAVKESADVAHLVDGTDVQRIFNNSVLRIADDLDGSDSSTIAKRWLQLARRLAKRRSAHHAAPLLILECESPWEVEFMATGQVFKLPDVPGLSQQDVRLACGKPASLSLAGEVAPDWFLQLFPTPSRSESAAVADSSAFSVCTVAL